MKGTCHSAWHMMHRIIVAACLAGLLLAIPGTGWTQTSATRPPEAKIMFVGGSELMTFQSIERLAVSDPTVFDYVVLSKLQIMLVAKKAGEGDLYVWDKAGRHTFHIAVTPPPSLLPQVVTRIREAIARPAISVTEHNGVIVLEGQAENAEEAKRAAVIARAYAPQVENLIRVVNAPVSDWTEPPSASPPARKTLVIGGSEMMDFHGIERVAVSDPTIIECVELSKKQIMLVAKKVGTTNLFVWDKTGPHPFHIAIAPPPSQLSEVVARINEGIARPAIAAKAHNEMVLLEGEVDSNDELRRAETIARAYAPDVVSLLRVRAAAVVPILDLNEIQRIMGTSIRISNPAEGVLLFEGVATTEQRTRLDQIVRALGNRVSVIDMVTTSAAQPRQVLVHVKAVEINRSALRELGVEWGGLSDAGATDQPILFGEVPDGPIPLDEFGPFRRLQGISARLKALVTTNKARILAEPNLLVVEGQLAEILVGGEIPIPVAQSLGSTAGSVSVEWKEFGVKLAIKPFISPGGEFVNLDVAPEVSNLDFGNAIVVNGLVLPALQTRKAHSVLHIRNGRTLVIGGLYQTEKTRTERKIPLLGDLPLVGNLFRRTDRLERETELVVFVTPEVVTEAASATRTQEDLRRMGEAENVQRQ